MDRTKKEKLLQAFMLFKTVTYKANAVDSTAGQIRGVKNSGTESFKVLFFDGESEFWVSGDDILV